MALVVLLRGVNVGGHRTFRPAKLATDLRHLGVVNIGAAGTFVVRKPVTQTKLRAELTRKLPFATHTIICEGREMRRLLTQHPFGPQPAPPGVVRFVTVLARRPASDPAFPVCFPPTGPWLLRVVARDGRFVFGEYRRDPKVIGYLGAVDRLFSVPVTTRNWNTITAIAKALEGSNGGQTGGRPL
jgi:uncharacterized protein (DUF1697 family)